MKVYDQKIWWKRLLFLFAVLIGALSLWYTNKLVQRLAAEEEKKVKLWAEAVNAIIKSNGENYLGIQILTDNETIPVILLDDHGNISEYRNLDSAKAQNPKYLQKELEEMKSQHPPIRILYDEENHRYNYLYYKNSLILTQLKRYPYYQLSVIGVFILVAYLAFSYSRRAEQNRVWVGMSKETAHQLGTPISSLNGWINLLRDTEKEQQEEVLGELEQDVKRLERITDRFSKIGSEPVLEAEPVHEVLAGIISYLVPRSSSKVHFSYSAEDDLTAMMNKPLFEWVLENLCKNAIDAMEGTGTIHISAVEEKGAVIIDIKDSGKGIPKAKFKTVFKPGYTTKKRGWGLGLSLAKRIIEDYHKGRILVKDSEPGKGTTFRIVLSA